MGKPAGGGSVIRDAARAGVSSLTRHQPLQLLEEVVDEDEWIRSGLALGATLDRPSHQELLFVGNDVVTPSGPRQPADRILSSCSSDVWSSLLTL